MANKNRLSVKNREQMAKLDRELANRGYVPLPRPAYFGGGSNDSSPNLGMEGFVKSKLYAESDACGAKQRVPRVFADSGCEVPTPDGVGTEGLGYMAWGSDDQLPNNVAILTELLPYMSASHKFNVDLVTGIGVEATYVYTQYVGGNLTEKEIKYENAGALLKGMKLDILREIANLPSESTTTGNSATVPGNATTVPGDSVAGPTDPYRKALEDRLAEIEDDIAAWEKTSEEVNDFFQRNNVHQTFLHLAADQLLLGMSFPEIDVQQSYIDPDTGHGVKTFKWQPKAIAIKHRSAMTARLERMDSQNRINYIYLSNRWLSSSVCGDTIVTKSADTDITALSALDPSCPSESMKKILADTRRENASKKHRPTRFILPVRIASPGRPYYPVPPHYSVFAGSIYDYAFTMIEDRNTAKQNSRVIGYVIYVHNDYLMKWYDQNQADTPEKKSKARNMLFSEINTFLANRDNHGKPLVSIMFRDADGKTAKAWEIVEIEGNNKNNVEANERELQEISSVIFFSWGVDARLIGNSPGDVTSSGGTDLRERYLLKQIQMSPTQQLLLRPFYVIRDINDWDLPHLRFRIRREVLTTLDRSKTGITTAETE